MSFSTHLAEAKEKLNVTFTLKTEQISALKSLHNGHDTVCLLRTGFGKSIIYQLSPFMLEHKIKDAITLVISPLNCIMQEQVMKLSRQGVRACYLDMKCRGGESFEFQSASKDTPETLQPDELNDDGENEELEFLEDGNDDPASLLKVSVPIDKIISGGYQLVYAHPEAFLTAAPGKALIRTPAFRRKVACVAIDEAHMISEWGEEFRTAFGRLRELVALFPQSPTLVLTATASNRIKEKLIADLGLQKPNCISVHPDRHNIKYTKIERSPASKQFDDLDNILLPIAKGLKEQGREYPITIMYISFTNMAHAYKYLVSALKAEDRYIGERHSSNSLFGMYHQCTSQRLKSDIVTELGRTDSKKRFVLATVALGMGLDAPAIRQVIHFGSPPSIEQYLQETGRAGRDGESAEAVLYYNRCDIRSNRAGQTTSMTDFCKSDNVCLRQQLLGYLDFEVPEDRVLCRCCTVCKRKCQCMQCTISGVENVTI